MEHTTHTDHGHAHGSADCSHPRIKHGDHVDYLHDGHLHHIHDTHIDEHRLEVTATNPAACTSTHACEGHAAGHAHGADCGHEAIPHGDHTDYLVAGHLHRSHDSHCDDHGILALA